MFTKQHLGSQCGDDDRLLHSPLAAARSVLEFYHRLDLILRSSILLRCFSFLLKLSLAIQHSAFRTAYSFTPSRHSPTPPGTSLETCKMPKIHLVTRSLPAAVNAVAVACSHSQSQTLTVTHSHSQSLTRSPSLCCRHSLSDCE